MKKFLHISIATTLLCGLSLSAHAQLIIGGEGIQRDCYEKALYGDMGTKQAIEICNDAVNQVSSLKNKTASHVNRGILYMRSGDFNSARKDYEKAINLSPNLREAYVNYGALLIHEKDYDGAITALNQAVEGETIRNLHEALYNRAIAYDRQDRFREAYLDLKRALELRPEWADAKRAISHYSVAKKSG